MTLVNLENILKPARLEKYSVPAFDISNYEMMMAVMEAAEEEKSPVILMALKPDLEGPGFSRLSSLLRCAAETATIPVCIHLDHSTEFELIKRAVDSGFSSVMFDGSILPFMDNVDGTKRVVDYAHKYGVSVEAELGHVGNASLASGESVIITDDGNQEDCLTRPLEVKEFVSLTDVDALAVAVGTAHGVYKEEPNLRFGLLQEINNVSKVPLVLHGGSGVPEESLKRCIELGICKVNIYTELVEAMFSSLYSVLAPGDKFSTWPVYVYKEPLAAMRKLVKHKIQILGSLHRAIDAK